MGTPFHQDHRFQEVAVVAGLAIVDSGAAASLEAWEGVMEARSVVLRQWGCTVKL